MGKKLPIVDADGRLWTWTPAMGYMPEADRQTAARKIYLRSIKQRAAPNWGEWRHKLAVAGNHRCGLCGGQFKNTVTLDHVVPRSKGGASVGNMIAAHRHCNAIKGNRLPTGCEKIWLIMVNAKLGLT